MTQLNLYLLSGNFLLMSFQWFRFRQTGQHERREFIGVLIAFFLFNVITAFREYPYSNFIAFTCGMLLVVYYYSYLSSRFELPEFKSSVSVTLFMIVAGVFCHFVIRKISSPLPTIVLPIILWILVCFHIGTKIFESLIERKDRIVGAQFVLMLIMSMLSLLGYTHFDLHVVLFNICLVAICVMQLIPERSAAISQSDNPWIEKFHYLKLSPTEIIVATMIMQRKTIKEIASTLGRTSSTATTHATRIYAKAGISKKRKGSMAEFRKIVNELNINAAPGPDSLQ